MVTYHFEDGTDLSTEVSEQNESALFARTQISRKDALLGNFRQFIWLLLLQQRLQLYSVHEIGTEHGVSFLCTRCCVCSSVYKHCFKHARICGTL